MASTDTKPDNGLDHQPNTSADDRVSDEDMDTTLVNEVDEKGIAAIAHEPKPDDDEQERWNESTIMILRYLQTLAAFLIMGMNDASVGALLPYIQDYYRINYATVACMFLVPFVGYALSACILNKIHMTLGQAGIAYLAPLCKIVAYAVTCAHPPFPAIPVIFSLTGIGQGLQDGAWNAWVGNMANGNELMGILHGAYGLGATIGPLVTTSMVTKGGLQWYTWYYVMTGLAVFELIIGWYAFRASTGAVYRAKHPAAPTIAGKKPASRTAEALRSPVTFLVAGFLFLYVGVEVALGGWVVTFMRELRDGEDFASGMVATGFWLGLTVGRVVLGFITGRIGEKLAVTIYLALCVGFQILFWQINNFLSSAIFIAWLGFFLGPLFPAAIMVATKLLPRRLHVSAIGFVAAFGSSGAAVFPFAVGAIAQASGVWVLQPFALALIAGIFIIWVILPGGIKKGGLDVAHSKMMEKEREKSRLSPQAENLEETV